MLAHVNSTLNVANNTLLGGHVSHVGQLFFDQKLIHEVEALTAYTNNTQPLLLNKDDTILEDEAATSDPVLNYVYLSDTVEDGLFGWVTVGIDPTFVTVPCAAAYIDENGGHANPIPSDGGPGDSPPGACLSGSPVPTGAA